MHRRWLVVCVLAVGIASPCTATAQHERTGTTDERPSNTFEKIILTPDDLLTERPWTNGISTDAERQEDTIAADSSDVGDDVVLASTKIELGAHSEAALVNASSVNTGRELLASQRKRRWHYYRSYLPLNRKRRRYPRYAKYRLPREARRLPKHYVPRTKSARNFSRAQRKWRPHSFRAARATHYGTNPRRGDSIDVGSCGYSYIHKGEACGNSCLDIAAISDVNPEYGGSCGRCYEVGCQPAAFTDGYRRVIHRKKACRNPNQTLVVHITDTCPCVYPKNRSSNRRWCCGDGTAPHFDLSINAFEKLASPKVGVIGLRYRQVPCWYQPSNIARRPRRQYHRENRKPRWSRNPKRGWNWAGRVAPWVGRQSRYHRSRSGQRTRRDFRPANVTGALASSARIPYEDVESI